MSSIQKTIRGLLWHDWEDNLVVIGCVLSFCVYLIARYL